MVDEQIAPAEEAGRAGSSADAARAALGRHAWQEAFDLLSEADARGELTPGELELLAQSAWWIGRLPTAIEVRERAFGLASRAGDVVTAVTAAIELAKDNVFRNDIALARAWIGRAERLLAEVSEGIGHGYLAAIRSFTNSVSGDNVAALADAEKAIEIGTRLGDRDLVAFATSEKGFALVAGGDVEAGLALIDEASVSAVGGELDPSTAGGVCCTSIEACAALGDWNRAAAWTEAQDRWCRREGISGGYPGMCRLFRSEIKLIRGSWLEAEAEARQASVELEGYTPAAAGAAFHRLAELRLLRGDLAGAEEALVRGHALGTDPEPILSLVRLAQGRTDLASEGIRQALEGGSDRPSWRAPPGSPLHRLPLLRAQVDIALTTSDVTTAQSAADELEEIAGRFTSAYTTAVATTARGAVLLAGDRAPEAITVLRRAVQQWNELAAPYEAARARMLLADAHAAGGGADRAVLELHAARMALEQLGAAPDVARVDDRLAGLLQERGPRQPSGGERVARTFVFTDIVDSTRLAELLGDEAWTKLVRWHDQTIRTAIAEHGGEEIKATGDGFFLAFPDAGAAVEAAIAIQRGFAEHRERNGFAPAVRIGLHSGEATRSGLDYLGMGVNYAARIGGVAEGGEIVASTFSLEGVRRSLSTSRPRTMRLKGISAPVDVVSVEWR